MLVVVAGRVGALPVQPLLSGGGEAGSTSKVFRLGYWFDPRWVFLVWGYAWSGHASSLSS